MAEPKIRFKANDGSDFPDWEEKTLGEITAKVERKSSEDTNAPVMMISQGNGFIYQADKYSRENAGQSLKKYTLLKRGEFAYNHGASKAKPFGVAYALNEEDAARVPFVYHTFEIVDGVNAYWHRALNTSQMDRQLKKLVSSGVRMDGLLNINYDTYMDVTINVPSLPEQQKIADFLSDLDNVISASEDEVANLEKQKKAVMQKIFSQEVRFKKEDGSDYSDWVEKPLGEVITFVNGRAYKQEELLASGKYLVLRVGNLFTNNEYYYSDLELDDDKYIDNGDLIYAWSATFGPRIFQGEKCIYHYHIWKCLFDDEIYSKKFLNQLLLNDVESIKRVQNGFAMMHITKENMEKRVLTIPSLPEQQLIADFLTSYDEAITAAKQELEKWKELKKGLLQQMFV